VQFRIVCSWLLVVACSSNQAAPVNDVALGDETFGSICAKCHGEQGRGGVPTTPGVPAPRDLGDPAWQASRSDADIARTIREGKLPMPAFNAVLTPDQIRAVVGKVRRLKR
jgi:mono/diheme cytochrome c family protein